MRELTYIDRRRVEWREAPDPVIDAGGQAIVAPIAATTCDVDSQILAVTARSRRRMRSDTNVWHASWTSGTR